MSGLPPTKQQYFALQQAYEHFNVEIFDEQLPPVLISLQRRAKSLGYFSRGRYSHRGDEEGVTDEVALNPDSFPDQTDEEILASLLHGMVHVWQAENGKPSRAGYHNKEWAAKMKVVGLHPSSTGEEGGKETGQSVSHYILAGGHFAQVCGRLLDQGFRIHWESTRPQPEAGGEKVVDPSKVKHTCPICWRNAWAK